MDLGLRTHVFRVNGGNLVNASFLVTSNIVSTYTILSLGLRENRPCLELALPTGLWVSAPIICLGIYAIEYLLLLLAPLSKDH